jgi:RNA polymerase sigma factor (sigma-70 family)
MVGYERPDLGEPALLERARSGSEDAYQKLVGVHRAELHAHCYQILGSVQDADDAVQDALLRAWRGLAGFEGRSSLRSWLYKIATNAALDVAQRRSRRELPMTYGPSAGSGEGPGMALLESVWVEPYPDQAFGVAGGLASPEAQYERRESLELAFVAALQYLPALQRAVLILREVLGFSGQETAGLLDTTLPAVQIMSWSARLSAGIASSTAMHEFRPGTGPVLLAPDLNVLGVNCPLQGGGRAAEARRDMASDAQLIGRSQLGHSTTGRAAKFDPDSGPAYHEAITVNADTGIPLGIAISPADKVVSTDFVVGADGLHSAVRRMMFGPASGYVRHLGMYVATLQLGYPAADPGTVLMYNMPGRSVSVHPVNGNAMAAFIFRSPAIPGLDNRDTAACKQVVLDAYRGGGWELPSLLSRLSAADDLYFDSVSRVRLPAWSRGRAALLGDAASCMSLFGNGSSLAITGAATLARALDATPDDHATAFRAYETEHRARVRPTQRGRLIAGALLVPATRAGITVRDLAVRLLARPRTPATSRTQQETKR